MLENLALTLLVLLALAIVAFGLSARTAVRASFGRLARGARRRDRARAAVARRAWRLGS